MAIIKVIESPGEIEEKSNLSAKRKQKMVTMTAGEAANAKDCY